MLKENLILCLHGHISIVDNQDKNNFMNLNWIKYLPTREPTLTKLKKWKQQQQSHLLPTRELTLTNLKKQNKYRVTRLLPIRERTLKNWKKQFFFTELPTSLSASVSTDLDLDVREDIILRLPCRGSILGRYSVSTENSCTSLGVPWTGAEAVVPRLEPEAVPTVAEALWPIKHKITQLSFAYKNVPGYNIHIIVPSNCPCNRLIKKKCSLINAKYTGKMQ